MASSVQGALVSIACAIALAPLAASVRAEPHGSGGAARAASAEPPSKWDVEAIDKYVAAEVANKGYVGLSMAIVHDGKLAMSKGYGVRSRATGQPPSGETPFAIGSLTKAFTCVALQMLVEEGKLSLDDRVSKFFPQLTRANEITLADLAAHTSGYPDYYPLDFLDERSRQPIKPDELLKKYAGGKLDFDPRTRWSYSNTGYTLLGRVIERATLMPLALFYQSRIFQPLGLAHTYYEPSEGGEGLAQGYVTMALGDPEPAPREASGWLGAAGGIWASATNLAMWDLALMNNTIIKRDAWQRMTTPAVLANGRGTGYGCGLFVDVQEDELVLGHGGEVNGFLASNTMIPRTKSAVILLSNDENVPLDDLRRALVRILVKATDAPPPTVRGPSAQEAARAFFVAMQSGAVDRATLGADFSAYFSPAKARAAAASLAPYGAPRSVEVVSTSERGGMEHTQVRIACDKAALRASMFRSSDGLVQQFLVEKD
jgi:CubicO group peptidase (beta-lactamase class C family)